MRRPSIRYAAIPRDSGGRLVGFLLTGGVKRPSCVALLLGLLPFVAMCFSVALWDRETPVVLGLPFNLFWLLAWVLATPLIMTFAYHWEKRR